MALEIDNTEFFKGTRELSEVPAPPTYEVLNGEIVNDKNNEVLSLAQFIALSGVLRMFKVPTDRILDVYNAIATSAELKDNKGLSVVQKAIIPKLYQVADDGLIFGDGLQHTIAEFLALPNDRNWVIMHVPEDKITETYNTLL
jgi:propanediol dehydratase small subunit